MAATNKRGVFSLEKVLERQSDNNWSNIFDPFRYILDSSFGTDYGYFGGGTYNTGGSSSSIIQRIDFNNDTANAKIFEVTGAGTDGKYGIINISGNTNSNNLIWIFSNIISRFFD